MGDVKYQLRDYQKQAVNNAEKFLRDGGNKRLYSAPCGTGKSYIEIELQQRLGHGCYIVTPRVEIAEAMIEKGGFAEQIFTPKILRNRLLDGRVTSPQWFIVDEGHHDTCDTANIIRLCIGDVPTVAFTATPFRGTPQGTAALRSLYGEPCTIITLHDAVIQGLVSLPTCRTIPVLDDDVVEIVNGEFNVKRVEGKTDWFFAMDLVSKLWMEGNKSTIVSLSSINACKQFRELLETNGIPSVCITAETRRDDRYAAFNRCVSGETILLQVNVISEGIDLPIRCLVDFAPTLSPVKWLQQIGRIMRPGSGSEYVCTNRNLMRHGYLLEGLVPIEAFTESQAAFPTQSRRIGIRAFGLEGVGKLKPCLVPLVNGLKAQAWYVSRDQKAEQYVAIVLPQSPSVLWARRTNGAMWGKWEQCNVPTELRGFASCPPRSLSLKQRSWWERDAMRHGLDAKAEIDSKIFSVLPVLSNIGMRIK